MILNDAIESIASSLKRYERVQAIFLKGSMGRGEEDEYSDIDLYCLVKESEQEDFLKSRLQHLQSYQQLLFYDEIHIVAPQIIAVYENLVHVDLFTVTEQTYIEKDYIKILYDPMQKLERYRQTQTLCLSGKEYQDAVDDVAWFLFQYSKASGRGNDLWAANMLQSVMVHLSKVLLHRYHSQRAVLGLKTVEQSLPAEITQEIKNIYEKITPEKHRRAVFLICQLLSRETDWILKEVDCPEMIKAFWNRMISLYL